VSVYSPTILPFDCDQDQGLVFDYDGDDPRKPTVALTPDHLHLPLVTIRNPLWGIFDHALSKDSQYLDSADLSLAHSLSNMPRPKNIPRVSSDDSDDALRLGYPDDSLLHENTQPAKSITMIGI
jgi:hypothetical protein